MILPDRSLETITGIQYGSKEIEIVSNNAGFELLSALSLFTGFKSEDCVRRTFVYLPVNYKFSESLRRAVADPFMEINLALVLVNYHAVPLNPKEMIEIIRTKTRAEKEFYLPDLAGCREYPFQFWDLKGKLTVKKHGKFLFLYGNRDIFCRLSKLAEFTMLAPRNYDRFNLFQHAHMDTDENTYKSTGVTLRFWLGDVQDEAEN